MQKQIIFFTVLMELLKDKEAIDLTIQRTEDELTILVNTKIAGKKAIFSIAGSAEELDHEFMENLLKPIDKILGLKTNVDEVKIEEDKDEDSTSSSSSSKNKSSAKKPAAKSKTNPSPMAKAVKKENDAEKKAAKEPVKKEPTPEELEQAAAKKAEEAKKLKEKEDNAKYDDLMKQATEKLKEDDVKKHYAVRKLYNEALEIKPDDVKAKEGVKQCNMWIDQLIKMSLLKPEEEMEVNNGTAD